MDFRALQQELDSDPDFKVVFIKDPGVALRSRGFDIDLDSERELRAEIDGALAKANVTVLVKFTIKF